MWNNIKYNEIAKIEKLVAEYNIWELNIIPYGKFKIKIFESSNHMYSGYTIFMLLMNKEIFTVQ